MHSSRSRTPPLVTIPAAPWAYHSRELLEPTSPTSSPADSMTIISPTWMDSRMGLISYSWPYQYEFAHSVYSSGLRAGTAFSERRSLTVWAIPVALAPWQSGAISGETVPLAYRHAQSMPSRTSATRSPSNRARRSLIDIGSCPLGSLDERRAWCSSTSVYRIVRLYTSTADLSRGSSRFVVNGPVE